MTAPSTRVVPVEATEILPCPFCGVRLEKIGSLSRRIANYYAHPDGEPRCQLATVGVWSDNAAAWNTRAPAAPVQGEGEAVAWRYPVLSARDEAIAAMARAMRNGQAWPAVFAPGAAEKLADDALTALEARPAPPGGDG